jgi:hypothetical protein
MVLEPQPHALSVVFEGLPMRVFLAGAVGHVAAHLCHPFMLTLVAKLREACHSPRPFGVCATGRCLSPMLTLLHGKALEPGRGLPLNSLRVLGSI